MPGLDLDLGGVTSAGKPLPEGDYTFLIEDATLKPSQAGTSHNLKLRLSVTSEIENGRIHTENLNIQEKTKQFVKAFLTALWGVEDEDVEGISFDVDEDTDTVRGINDQQLVGSEIGGTIKHVDSDDGRTFGNVVAWFTA